MSLESLKSFYDKILANLPWYATEIVGFPRNAQKKGFSVKKRLCLEKNDFLTVRKSREFYV